MNSIFLCEILHRYKKKIEKWIFWCSLAKFGYKQDKHVKKFKHASQFLATC
jgi:hypothetical protein